MVSPSFVDEKSMQPSSAVWESVHSTHTSLEVFKAAADARVVKEGWGGAGKVKPPRRFYVVSTNKQGVFS